MNRALPFALAIVATAIGAAPMTACGSTTGAGSIRDRNGASSTSVQSAANDVQDHFQRLRSRVEASSSPHSARTAFWGAVCDAAKDLDGNYSSDVLYAREANDANRKFAEFFLHATKYASGVLEAKPGALSSADFSRDSTRFYGGHETVCDIAASL